MPKQGRNRRRAPRQRGRGQPRIRRQRGRGNRLSQKGAGRVRDFIKKAGKKISDQIGKIIKSKRGQQLGKKALQSFVKAGEDIIVRGANPKRTIKTSLKKTGGEIGREIVGDFLQRKL